MEQSGFRLKVILDLNVSAKNYETVMSFFATGRLAAFRQGIRAHTDLLPTPLNSNTMKMANHEGAKLPFLPSKVKTNLKLLLANDLLCRFLQVVVYITCMVTYTMLFLASI